MAFSLRGTLRHLDNIIPTSWWLLERFSIEWRKTKAKVITTANQKKGNITRSQWELRVKTTKLFKARENAGDQVVVLDFCFASDWLRGRCEFPGPIKKRGKAKPKYLITLDYFRQSQDNCTFFNITLNTWDKEPWWRSDWRIELRVENNQFAPWPGHCVVFLDKTCDSNRESIHSGE